jgi:hypothetical protein
MAKKSGTRRQRLDMTKVHLRKVVCERLEDLSQWPEGDRS